ncbi:conserved membrane protein of unknown function [Candidatus Promineifilum breve]|uniref:DUF4064 domain-containing protein n=1 Tax=Candidatus Promineifilum breve TaxID=1806508 RepID=A0A160TAE7_9CHLR|nr:hypothetical protein [Candidatus Promineifilum breve]CUS06070.1 conserved membrane protein of unknown function [Candidatus Promineifilum breve]
MVTERPSGVTILAIIYILLGLLSLVWSLLVFGVGAVTGLTGAIVGAENMASFGTANFWGGIIGVAGATLDFIIAYGLLNLRPWGWMLALIGLAITVITGVLGLMSGGFFAICCGILGLLVPAGILFYLLQPEVRKAFGR